jgi:arginyl-tRNA synthetase
MSTRGGKVVYLDDLLDEAIGRARTEVSSRHAELSPEEVERIARSVGAAAVRYHIGRVAPEKAVAFRWEDALSFEGRSGPFVQYSYARASSLLRKAGTDSGAVAFEPDQLGTPPERRLLREISRLPRTVSYAARTTHVHAVAAYAHSLAEAFNQFYESTPVLNAEAPRKSRLALVAAARTTLGNTLALLGIDSLERM